MDACRRKNSHRRYLNESFKRHFYSLIVPNPSINLEDMVCTERRMDVCIHKSEIVATMSRSPQGDSLKKLNIYIIFLCAFSFTNSFYLQLIMLFVISA